MPKTSWNLHLYNHLIVSIMGKNYQGINGNWSGKVGNNVGQIVAGRTVIRIYQPLVANPQTDAQQENRQRLSVASEYLRGAASLLRLGMTNKPAKVSAFAEAVRFARNNAVTGSYPSLSIDAANVVVANGSSVDLPYNPSASYDTGTITIIWTDNSGIGNAERNDTVVVAVRNLTRGEWLYDAESSDRSARTVDIMLPALWAGDSVAVYMFMTRGLGKSSSSLYLGNFTV